MTAGTGSDSIQDGSTVYKGFRAFLARILKVPMQPAEIPVGAGELLDSFHPAPGWLRLNWWILSIVFLMMFGATTALAIILGVAVGPAFIFLLVVPVFVLLPLFIFSLLCLRLRYDCTWYVLTERALRIRRGLVVIQETTITYENVQNVNVRQGPLARMVGISNITVETAGGGGAPAGTQATTHGGFIEGVEEAEALRDRIMAQVRKSRSAGLGDEHPSEWDGASACSTDRPADWTRMATVLREIRDGLRAAGS